MQALTELDGVIKKTLTAVEQGKSQITSIAEGVRMQRNELLARLVEIKGEILEVITKVDKLEREDKLARFHLMEVNRNFTRYVEKDIQLAYEEAQYIQLQLTQMREREVQYRQRRDQLEIMLRRAAETLAKAEKLQDHVNMALQLLSGGSQGVSFQPDELQLRQQLSLRIIKAQEEERSRVAREIHDGPAQSLANVVLRAEICEKLISIEPDKVRGELHDLKEMVKESLQEVRKIIFSLRPTVLDDLGIVPTLRCFIQELQKRTEMNIELVVLGGEEERLASALEVAIFRIVQEALNNSLKHAKARRCVIKLEILAGRVNISIADDGCGFDTEPILHSSERDCFGISGMRERVELLNGRIRIVSRSGKGTEIYVSIPAKKKLD